MDKKRYDISNNDINTNTTNNNTTTTTNNNDNDFLINYKNFSVFNLLMTRPDPHFEIAFLLTDTGML